MSSPGNQNSTDNNYEIIINYPKTLVDEPPTESQKEKLLQFEEEFKSRYTDDDEDYVATVKLGFTTPPLVLSYRPFWNRRRDNKRKWEDRSDRHSHYSHHNKRNCGYNNDYRR